MHQCRVTKAVDGRVGERTMTRTCARGSEGKLLQQQHHTPALSVVEDPAQLHLHTRREREVRVNRRQSLTAVVAQDPSPGTASQLLQAAGWPYTTNRWPVNG